MSEIEAQTKIRAKYLRALENEEWDLLPGPTYVKSFLRTYAQALGLDDKALLEQYRLGHERLTDAELQPIMPASRRQRERAAPPRRGGALFVTAVGVFVLIIALAIYGLVSGGSSGTTHAASTHKPTVVHRAGRRRALTIAQGASTHRGVVALQVKATGSVWVCLTARGNRTLLDGVILTPADASRTYHSSRFEMTLGNSSVALRLNGQPLTIPGSSLPISFSLSAAGRRTLSATELPHCA